MIYYPWFVLLGGCGGGIQGGSISINFEALSVALSLTGVYHFGEMQSSLICIKEILFRGNFSSFYCQLMGDAFSVSAGLEDLVYWMVR